MINLYQMLNIPPHSSTRDIQAALQNAQARLDPKIIKAVNEWLLSPDVRPRYDARLRQEQPDFFMPTNTAAAPQPKPKIVLSDNTTQNDDDYMDLPPLWNPKAAMWWSLLLNAVFGMVLHAKNWEALDEKELAKQNWIWVAGAALITFIVVLTPSITNSMALGIQIGLIIGWYQILGKKQVQFFEETFGDDYERNGWILPIILAIAIIFAVAIIATIISPDTP